MILFFIRSQLESEWRRFCIFPLLQELIGQKMNISNTQIMKKKSLMRFLVSVLFSLHPHVLVNVIQLLFLSQGYKISAVASAAQWASPCAVPCVLSHDGCDPEAYSSSILLGINGASLPGKHAKVSILCLLWWRDSRCLIGLGDWGDSNPRLPRVPLYRVRRYSQV